MSECVKICYFAGAENAGVENAGVDSRGGKCRSDKVWKAVRIEKSKIPEVYAKTKRTHEQRPDVHNTPGSVRTHGLSSCVLHAQGSH